MFNNALVVEKDTLGDGYNQVKGKFLYGKFKDNALRQIDFLQNTESIYYVYNDAKELVGINKLTCSHIKLYLDKKAATTTNCVYYTAFGEFIPRGEIARERLQV